MKKRGITVLIYNANEPLPKQGGMERITDRLARGLRDNGIRTVLLCSRRNRLGENYKAPVPIYYFPSERKKEFLIDLIEKNSVTHIIDQAEGGIIGKFGIFKKKTEIFNDIALIAVQHNSSRAIINNFKIAMRRDCNCQIRQGIYDKIILPIRKIHSIWLIKKLYKELSQNYDKIVMLSESFINDFIWFNKNADKNKLLAIPNMNSYTAVVNKPKENRVLFVGRLISSTKGCDKLLRIWQYATVGIDGWYLDIVGDGVDKEALEEYAKKHDIKNCIFHGFKDPRSFYEKAKIFCMCSIYEGFGLVLTEAMQHGVIPLAFDSFSSVRDIISDGETGFLIQPFDEQSYAYKLRALITDASWQKNMSETAKKTVEKFSIENVITQWVQLIEDIDKSQFGKATNSQQ